MRDSVVCFTSFTFSYLTRALIMVRTLRQAHPTWKIWALITDKPPPGTDFSSQLAEFDNVLSADQLEIPRFDAWLFKHDVVEASTAVKGEMLRHLLRAGAEVVVYLDPDIAVFHSLDSTIAKLSDASILLTPHQVEPNTIEGSIRDNELTSLKYGVFNLGFLAVKNDETGSSFAEWWAKQLHFACYDEPQNGLFTDQKWCDLVPGLFDRVLVERDPGCNVASWNLSQRHLHVSSNGGILVNDSPLKFYHFTKIDREGDLMTEKYSGDNVEVMEVWKWYKRALEHTGVSNVPKGYWHYGNFSNGVKIPKSVRELFRYSVSLYEYFEDPFRADGDSFFRWLERERADLLSNSIVGGFEAI
jgi:hypothetical protein